MRVFVLIGLLVAVGTAAAETKAEKYFAQGRTYMRMKDYEKACTAFQRSFDEEPAVGTLLNLGLCHEKTQRWVESYRSYDRALVMARAANDPRADNIVKLVDASGRKVGRVKLIVPEGATSTLDGEPIEEVDAELVMLPGAHEIVVTIDNDKQVEKVDLQEGERKVVRVEPRAKPAPAPEAAPAVPGEVRLVERRRPGRIAIGAVMLLGGLGTAGYGGYVLFDARKDYRRADCPDGVCATQEDVDLTRDAKARARRSTYFIAGGAVAAGIGTLLMISGRKRQDRVAITPLLGNGFGVAIGGSL